MQTTRVNGIINSTRLPRGCEFNSLPDHLKKRPTSFAISYSLNISVSNGTRYECVSLFFLFYAKFEVIIIESTCLYWFEALVGCV